MATIIAGRFQLQEQIDQARGALMQAGFPAEKISAFYVNPPGQHDMHGMEGDHVNSPGAKEAPEGLAKGAATGAAVGAAIGTATAIATGPLGPAVGALLGAHVGSLYSFSHMKDAGEPEPGGQNREAPRQAGMLIAVALDDKPSDQQRQRALDVLQQQGATELELAEGSIVAGDWCDFNPNSLPRRLG
jgi:hypothetical protein